MGWLEKTSPQKSAWERAKAAVQNARLLAPHVPLAGWANGDQMVYAVNPVYLEIGQGGSSPMRGWGAVVFAAIPFVVALGLWTTFTALFDTWSRFGVGGQDGLGFGALIEILVALILFVLSGWVCFLYFAINFLNVTDPTVRLDHKRKKVWMWAGQGPIQMNWANLVPRVEASAASVYATVKLYRGQYAELGQDGLLKVTNGIPHVFQCGQVSAAEEGVRPSMEYVRLYMESGPHAVPKPEKLLSHRPRWYAMVNLFGVADDWVRWSENRDKPGIAPAPWTRTVIGLLLFPIFFPMQVTNWLALMVAPKPKWPKELERMHEADLAEASQAEASRIVERQKRKPVIRVNGTISGSDGES